MGFQDSWMTYFFMAGGLANWIETRRDFWKSNSLEVGKGAVRWRREVGSLSIGCENIEFFWVGRKRQIRAGGSLSTGWLNFLLSMTKVLSVVGSLSTGWLKSMPNLQKNKGGGGGLVRVKGEKRKSSY